MKKILMIFIQIIFCFSSVKAAETGHQYFTIFAGEYKAVASTGGSYTAKIDGDTGALSNSMKPTFTVDSNSNAAQRLTLSAVCNTQSGNVNALFLTSGTKYIILSNTADLPTLSAINNIKGISPSEALNPNAIAYVIQDPPVQPCRLNVSWRASNNWRLTLTGRGLTNTSVTIPAGCPRNNTFSFNDGAGDYCATIILSYD